MVLFSFFIKGNPSRTKPREAFRKLSVLNQSQKSGIYLKTRPPYSPDFSLLMAISTRLSSHPLLRFLLVSTAQRLSGHTPLGKSGDVLDTAHGVG